MIKVYEALGSVADGRVEVSGDTAKVYSSSRNKYYDVAYDPASGAIMANDNSSFWQGNLGYTSIAFLLKIGVLKYDPKYGDALKGIAWKDINTKFKNNFDKTQKYCDELISEKGINLDEFQAYTKSVMDEIIRLDLKLLGKKVKPPEGY